MFPLGTARCSKVVANLCNTNKTPPRLRGQREISVVCFQRTSAALVYNLQASLHCTRWHELCDNGRFISPKEYSTSGEQGRWG